MEENNTDFSKLSELEKFKYNLRHFGFLIPQNAEFYKDTVTGRIGMKVGEYSHSCHVESSNITILFHLDENNNHELKEYWWDWHLKRL